MSIEQLVPSAGQEVASRLAAFDADALARYVLEVSHPWWRRRPCARALRGRVPAVHVPALLARIRDHRDEAEVRIALLEVLGDRAELLPWLQAPRAEASNGMTEAVLGARAAIGDLTAVPAIAAIANAAWPQQRASGEAALDLLIARHGEPEVERHLDITRPDDRLARLRLRHRRGEDVTPYFADPDVAVARAAAELAVDAALPDHEQLQDHVITAPTTNARLWALYVLHRRGRAITALWDALDRPRVELPGLPEDVRRTIVAHHAPERRTDPRWLVERICSEVPAPDEAGLVACAVAALDDAGLAPGAPREIGEVNQQGGGTYHVVELGDEPISICSLGAFATAERDDHPARAALERAGFRWIDRALATIRVEGLCVYYFGERESLDVQTLLFYWQD